MTMIKGYVINITSNLIIWASCLAWGSEENVGLRNNSAAALKDTSAVKHRDTCSCIASGYELVYIGIGQAGT